MLLSPSCAASVVLFLFLALLKRSCHKFLLLEFSSSRETVTWKLWANPVARFHAGWNASQGEFPNTSTSSFLPFLKSPEMTNTNLERKHSVNYQKSFRQVDLADLIASTTTTLNSSEISPMNVEICFISRSMLPSRPVWIDKKKKRRKPSVMRERGGGGGADATIQPKTAHFQPKKKKETKGKKRRPPRWENIIANNGERPTITVGASLMCDHNDIESCQNSTRLFTTSLQTWGVLAKCGPVVTCRQTSIYSGNNFKRNVKGKGKEKGKREVKLWQKRKKLQTPQPGNSSYNWSMLE